MAKRENLLALLTGAGKGVLANRETEAAAQQQGVANQLNLGNLQARQDELGFRRDVRQQGLGDAAAAKQAEIDAAAQKVQLDAQQVGALSKIFAAYNNPDLTDAQRTGLVQAEMMKLDKKQAFDIVKWSQDEKAGKTGPDDLGILNIAGVGYIPVIGPDGNLTRVTPEDATNADKQIHAMAMSSAKNEDRAVTEADYTAAKGILQNLGMFGLEPPPPPPPTPEELEMERQLREADLERGRQQGIPTLGGVQGSAEGSFGPGQLGALGGGLPQGLGANPQAGEEGPLARAMSIGVTDMQDVERLVDFMQQDKANKDRALEFYQRSGFTDEEIKQAQKLVDEQGKESRQR